MCFVLGLLESFDTFAFVPLVMFVSVLFLVDYSSFLDNNSNVLHRSFKDVKAGMQEVQSS